jgi:hypothetical protein
MVDTSLELAVIVKAPSPTLEHLTRVTTSSSGDGLHPASYVAEKGRTRASTRTVERKSLECLAG